METTLLEPEANLEKVILRLHEAAERGADLAVFPECALTGYALTAEEAEAVAETIPGPRTARLTEACREAGALAVVGTIEKDEAGCCFNTAVLVGPSGVLATYRKTHLPCLGVDRFLAAGDSLPGPFDTQVGSLGLLICYDLRFPEPIRVLALAGAQMILLPTAWPARATLYPEFINRARSEENHVYIVAANRVGEERGVRYLGRSIITDPDGDVMAEASTDGEEILCVEVDLARSDRKQIIVAPGEYELDLFGDRRPELYRDLADA
jgi:predicted amidohydrolase